METKISEPPLKVCRHCSVASRTEAATCPNCGKPYERQRLQWRWWMAIPIVVLAFGAGYFGLSKLLWGDDEAETTISQAQAHGVPDDTSEDELAAELGGLEPAVIRNREEGNREITCRYYKLDEEDAAWEFCFADNILFTSVKIGGEGGVSPIPPDG